jgi:hypothetical protein
MEPSVSDLTSNSPNFLALTPGAFTGHHRLSTFLFAPIALNGHHLLAHNAFVDQRFGQIAVAWCGSNDFHSSAALATCENRPRLFHWPPIRFIQKTAADRTVLLGTGGSADP